MKKDKEILAAVEEFNTAMERDPSGEMAGVGEEGGLMDKIKELKADKDMLEKQMEKLGIPKFR